MEETRALSDDQIPGPVNRRASWRITGLAIAVAMACANVASAASADANTIIGVFSDPILSGYALDVGSLRYTDNTATAVTTGAGTSSISWGTNPGRGPQATGNFSYLRFTGATSLPLDAPSPATIGTITYFNGTSIASSVIFGATLLFYLNSVAPANLLGSDTVYINSSSNQSSGTGLTAAQLNADSDSVNICGHSSNICNSAIQSSESTEVVGYVPLTVDLNATYQFDASNPGDGGFSAEPPATLPEPASLTGFVIGLLGLGALRRRAR